MASSLVRVITLLASGLALAACKSGGDPPDITLSASASSVTSGSTVTLTWSVRNDPDSCTASGNWSGSKAASGSETSAALTANATFTLSCTNDDGTRSRSVNVTVTAPPAPTVTLTANPATVAVNGTSQLTWSSTNATSCAASGGWTGAKATSGTQATPALAANTTFTLACTGAGGTATQSVTVNVSATPPPTVTLAANPTSVAVNGTSQITWSSTNATACTASGTGWSGARATSGTETTAGLPATRTFTLTCAGAGGSAAQTVTVTVVPAPTVTLTANPTAVNSGGTTALTWSSTNATACTSSGGWTGSRATSGTFTSGALTTDTTFTLTCTGTGGSGSASATVTVNAGVTISGTITFTRPTRSGDALNYTTTENVPARGIVVQILQGSSGSTVLATTTTDSAGLYSVTLATSQTIRVRARAEMIKTGTAPTWDFQVLNNTSGNALYVLDSTAQTPAGATLTVNVNAPIGRSGANGSNVTGTRASAPFAILDAIYRAREMLVAANGSIALAPIDFYWAPANTSSTPTSPAACAGDPNPVTGQIGTTFFLPVAIADPDGAGACAAVPRGIYVLGDAALDTDEFDSSVVAHEFGHYYEDTQARGDSMGGPHALASVTDMRLAWSEGFCNAYSGMVLNDSTYRDTFAVGSTFFSFNMESDSTLVEGWFSETSVGELVWDVFDSVNDGSDAVSLGFGPIHSVLNTTFRNNTAMATVHSFFATLIAANASQSTALTNLRNGEGIAGTDAFGAGETNAAGLATTSLALPVYTTLALATPTQTVSSNRFPETDPASFASFNRLGARRYFRISLPANGNYQVTAQGPTTPSVADPDFVLYRQGVEVCAGQTASPGGLEQRTCNGMTAGTYVLEVAECTNLGALCAGPSSTPRGDTAITVTVTQL